MNSLYDKDITNAPICNTLQMLFHLFTLYPYFSIRVKITWNIGDNRNLFLQLKSNLGLHHVVHSYPKTYPEKLTLTVVEMQQMPDIGNADSKEEISCLKWTKM